MKEILSELDRWSGEGQEIALATVVDVEGSAPRPSGARLCLTRSGSMVGSVSGGCVESDVYARALHVLDDGQPVLTSYGPAEQDSFEVGLSCDGRIEVLIEPFVADEVWRRVRAAVEQDTPAAMAIGLGPGALLGLRMGLLGEGEAQERVGGIDPSLDAAIATEAARLLRGRGRGAVEIEGRGRESGPSRIFIETFVPAQRLYVVGATHTAIPLCRMAREVGFRVSVIDPRSAFSGGDRFQDAHEVLQEWPVDVLERVELNADAYVLTLTHDPKFDLPVLARALRSDVRYVGALGSRGTHAKRLSRLREQGFGDEELARIHTPVGLNLGGRAPAEVALSILAEMIAVRHARDGKSLSGGGAH
jgi:xanthine dehydrogenase accessory factor